MLDEALSFPLEGEELTRRYLIGSGLILASFFVGLTVIPLYGYYLRVIDAGRTGSHGLPPFDDWEELIVDGIKMFVVNFVYAGIPGVVFFGVGVLVLFGIGLGAVGESGAVVLIVLLLGGLVSVAAGLLWVVGLVAAPAALAHMQTEGEFAAAFQLRTIFTLVTTGEYLVAVLLGLVLGGVISLVGSALSFLLVGLPVLFFGGIVTFHLYGQGYQRAREAKLGPNEGATDAVPQQTRGA
jgi:hypothetical protein